MSISITRYFDITSAVGGASVVSGRQFIGRLITTNAAIPPGTMVSFNNADDVGKVFNVGGATSAEYARASKYFRFINKMVDKPSTLQFVRWNTSATAPMIVGDTTTKTLASFTAISSGNLIISINGTPSSIGSINFSTATSLTQVASILQAAIRAVSGVAQFATATVTYNSNLNQFNLVCSVAQTDTISVSVAVSNDISGLLGWSTSGSQKIPGMNAQTALDAITQSTAANNDFGSFAYLDPLTNNDIQAVSAWTDLQNEMYMYCAISTVANMATVYAAIKGYSGVGLHAAAALPDTTNNFTEQCQMEILAATDWTSPSAGDQNYMYYQFSTRTPTVFDDPTADLYDQNRCNYIGQTQVNGQALSFYQTGILMGGSNAATDMNVFANEMWLKDSILVGLVNYFLAVPGVSTGPTGRAGLLGVLQDVANKGISNAVIVSGKNLDSTQKAYITNISGNSNVWRTVQSNGYWYDIQIVSFVDNTGATKYKAKYIFIYSKDDQVRHVSGSDILI